MQIKYALEWGHQTLLSTSPSARLDAELLLAHVLGRPVTFLLAHDEQKICSIKWWRYRRMIRRRAKGEPVAYITGHKEFYCLDFWVNRHTLIPRPDTEILAEEVINYARDLNGKKPSELLLLDVGAGSGCIPVAVCKNVEGLRAMGTDVSRRVLSVARKNARAHGLSSRITFVYSDLLKNVGLEWLEGKEVILTANLPYLPTGMKVAPELGFEPPLALYGGPDGLDIYRRLADQLKVIRPRALFFELFESQIPKLSACLPEYRQKKVVPMSGEARLLVMERTDN